LTRCHQLIERSGSLDVNRINVSLLRSSCKPCITYPSLLTVRPPNQFGLPAHSRAHRVLSAPSSHSQSAWRPSRAEPTNPLVASSCIPPAVPVSEPIKPHISETCARLVGLLYHPLESFPAGRMEPRRANATHAAFTVIITKLCYNLLRLDGHHSIAFIARIIVRVTAT
jgi:hypothetical protein